MKKILLAFFALSIALVSCNKSDDDNASPNPNPNPNPGPTPLTVEKKNRAAVIYFGEDWCPPCGTYGGPTLDSLLAANEGSLLTGMKINGSSNNSSLNWSGGNNMYSQFNSGVFNNASTIPAMAVNQQKVSVTTSISQNYNSGYTKANTFSTTAVKAGVALRYTITGDSIAVETPK